MTQLRTKTNCPHCHRPFATLRNHVQLCLANTGPDWSEVEAEQAYMDRAAAHASYTSLRAAQRFQHGVTDTDVTVVMYALERGTPVIRNRAGRWIAPAGSPIGSHWRPGRNLSVVINEMIRTGLLRHVVDRTLDTEVDHLVPALVHLRDVTVTGEAQSACLFTGEDMGPMRARLVDSLAIVDCLSCEAVVATGYARGL
jgi:hypothetical protein